MRRLFLLLILSVVLVACSSIECPIENTVAVNYAVMKYQNGEEVADTLNDTLWVWSRRADGDDTLLYNRGVNVRSFSLPTSYQGPQDTLIFLTVDTLQNYDVDTVWISKEDILLNYMNTIALGQSIYGVQAASEAFLECGEKRKAAVCPHGNAADGAGFRGTTFVCKVGETKLDSFRIVF